MGTEFSEEPGSHMVYASETINLPTIATETVWPILLRACRDLGYKVIEMDGHNFAANTGRSIWTQRGQDVLVTIRRNGAGSTVFLQAVMAENRIGQSWDWGESRRVVKKLSARVNQLCLKAAAPSERADRSAVDRFMQAVAKGDESSALAASQLIDRDFILPSGDSMLCIAVLSGNLRLVERLIARGAEVGMKSGHEQMAPLHAAAASGRAQMARILAEAGAAIDVRDVVCRTPLHTACMFGAVDVARVLLEYNADPNCLDLQGGSPLVTAISGPLIVPANVLGQIRETNPRARYDAAATVAELLKHGARTRTKLPNGMTLMSIAQHVGDPAVISLLRDIRE